MRSFILHESEYLTYPYLVFRELKPFLIGLNWRVSNAECYGEGVEEFRLSDSEDTWLSGSELFDALKEAQDVQWVWGLLSGFSPSVSREDAYAVSTAGLFDSIGIPSMRIKPVRTINPLAEIEIVAFDSSDTYVVTDDESVIRKLKEAFPKCEEI